MKGNDKMQEPIKYCELDPNKVCDNCNECNICDLDPNKLCDSCGKCLEADYGDYNELKLDGVIDDETEIDEYVYDAEIEEKCDTDNWDDKTESDGIKIEYIEDIPELKKEYDKILESILNGTFKDHDDNDECDHEHDHCDCHDNHDDHNGNSHNHK
jgi:hypothetical protein